MAKMEADPCWRGEWKEGSLGPVKEAAPTAKLHLFATNLVELLALITSPQSWEDNAGGGQTTGRGEDHRQGLAAEVARAPDLFMYLEEERPHETVCGSAPCSSREPWGPAAVCEYSRHWKAGAVGGLHPYLRRTRKTLVPQWYREGERRLCRARGEAPGAEHCAWCLPAGCQV